MDRLSFICSAVILRRANLSNVCSLLADGTHFNALPLVQSIRGYIAQSLETFLDSQMLYDLPVNIVRQLSAFIRWKQAEKSPLSRSNRLIAAAMLKPLMHTTRAPIHREKNARLSPPGPMRVYKSSSSPSASPLMRPQLTTSRSNAADISIAEDEVFVMDEIDSMPRSDVATSKSIQETALSEEKEKIDSGDVVSGKHPSGWKVSAAPKYVDAVTLTSAELTSMLGLI